MTAFIAALKRCVALFFLTSFVSAYAGDVTVYAAASLTEAISDLSKKFKQANPEISVKTSFAGSSTLAKQIENGAPAQVFISADQDWMDYLQTRGLIDKKTRVELLTNELVLVAPVTSRVKITLQTKADGAAVIDGKLCTGDPAYVPVGKYAKHALTFYGWWDAIQPKIVGAEDVRTALAFVQRGECSVGIVYKTDALLNEKVKIVATFPSASHPPIVYPLAVTRNATPDALAFWQFLQSEPARTVFASYGFIPVP